MSSENHKISSETLQRLRQERDEALREDRETGFAAGWEWAEETHYSVLRDYAEAEENRAGSRLPADVEIEDDVTDKPAYTESFSDAVAEFWAEVEDRLSEG